MSNYIRYVSEEIDADGQPTPVVRVVLDGEFTSQELAAVLRELWRRGAVDDLSGLLAGMKSDEPAADDEAGAN